MLTNTNDNQLWPHNKRQWFNTTTNTADSNSHTCVQHTEELQVELHKDTLKEHHIL